MQALVTPSAMRWGAGSLPPPCHRTCAWSIANHPDWPLAKAPTLSIIRLAGSGSLPQLKSRPSFCKAKNASWLTPTCLAPSRMRTGTPRPVQP
jgi:hypothetical protein